MRLRVLTWHVHGSYMKYLLHAPHDFYLPVTVDKAGARHGGVPSDADWPSNAVEIPAAAVRGSNFDVILYQHHDNWHVDRHKILSDAQRTQPSIFLEHDPPREHPTDTRHPVSKSIDSGEEANVLIAHVTHFNQLMWDSGPVSTTVIEHGVAVPEGVTYSGELERGLVVINGLARRGRRLGADIFEELRREVPLDLVGLWADESNGLGEVKHAELPAFEARYRFLLNPIRYTSFGLSVIEAMMVGLPIIGLATTEMVRHIQNGVHGYLSTNPRDLVPIMQRLLADRDEAQRLGENARQLACERFNIERFARNWDQALRSVAQL